MGGSMTVRRGAAAVGVLISAILVAGATAWACISVASLSVSPAQAQPGQQVEVKGEGYNTKPVDLRFNGLDGPVLATVTAQGGAIKATVTIPQDAKPGNYVVFATQEAQPGNTTWGIPSRALVTVTNGTTPVLGAPLAPVEEGRVTAFERQDSVSGAALLLVGLGVAGMGLFLVGVTAFLQGRPPRAVPAKARAN